MEAKSFCRAKTPCYNRAPFNQKFFSCLSISLAHAVLAQRPGAERNPKPGGKMTFDETLYGRDDEMDEFGDSGAYGDSLEEDYEEEEEEEEAAEVPAIIESQPEPAAPAPSAPRPASGGGGSKPPRKPAAKKAAKK